jgi:hypothetical protein
MSQSTPAERLRGCVDSIVDRASVKSGDRAEIAEEMYGHLWQRWQDGIAAGLPEAAAVDAAIAGFGDPGRLGRDLTAAYHSRLYASTVGVLLPTVATSSDKPNGYGMARAFLFLIGAVEALTVLGVLVLNRLTPVRMLATELMMLAAVSITVIAYRALARWQRWALVYVKFLALTYVGYCVVQVFVPPTTISITGILVAMFVLPAVFDPRLKEWVAASRRTGRVIGAVIVASVLMGIAANPLAAAMPDPTQASATDLSMAVHVDCTRTAGAVTAATLKATLRWSRTDFLPQGFRPGMSQTDDLGVSATAANAVGENAPPFPNGLEDEVVASDWAIVDAATGKSAAVDVFMLSSVFFDVGVDQLPIDPGSIQANRDYVATFDFVSAEPTGLPDDPIFRIRYDHQARWGVEAFATCGQSSVGHPVTTPDPPVGSML